MSLLLALALAAADPVEALLGRAEAQSLTDSAAAAATAERALALQLRAPRPARYPVARTRTLIALYRAFAGDRAGQIDPMAAGAAAMVAEATTPREREEAAVATLTVAQFATTAGRAAIADATLARGLALLARPDTRQGQDAAEGYDIAAEVSARRGRFAESLDYAQRAVATAERAGPASGTVSRSLGAMATALIRLGRVAEAEPALRRALDSAETATPPSTPNLLLALQRLADFYARTGRGGLAEPLYRRALMLADGLPRGFRYSYPVARALAALLLDRGDAAAARALVSAGTTRSAATLGTASPEHAAMLVLLVRTELALGRTAEARRAAGQAEAIYRAALSPDDARHGDARAALAAVDLADGRIERAVAGYRAALAGMAGRAGDDPELLAARLAAADALSRDPRTLDEAWTLARDTAERLTRRLTDLDGAGGREVDLAPGERLMFDRSVAIAWARARSQ